MTSKVGHLAVFLNLLTQNMLKLTPSLFLVSLLTIYKPQTHLQANLLFFPPLHAREYVETLHNTPF